MLFEKINEDIVENMKSKNTVDLTILRTLKADIQKVAIDTRKEITDDVTLDVIAKSIKQLNDVLTVMTSDGPNYKAYEHRVQLLSKYLPAQMSEDEVIALVNEVKAQVSAMTKKDMGKMMKELTPKTKGKFDSKRLSQIVSSVLA